MTAKVNLGYAGQRCSIVNSHYLLGNGYRGFNPVLKRFSGQDSLSPFSVGGEHGYIYSNNNPINNTDPTGHGPLIDFVISMFYSMVRGLKSEVEVSDILAGKKVVQKTLKDASAVEPWDKISLDGGKVILGANREVSASLDGLKALKYFAERETVRVKGRKINVLAGTHGEPDGENWLFGKYKQTLHVNQELMDIFNALLNNPGIYYPELEGRVNLVDTRKINEKDFAKILSNPDEHSVLLYCFSRNDQTLLEALNLEPVVSWVHPKGFIPE